MRDAAPGDRLWDVAGPARPGDRRDAARLAGGVRPGDGGRPRGAPGAPAARAAGARARLPAAALPGRGGAGAERRRRTAAGHARLAGAGGAHPGGARRLPGAGRRLRGDGARLRGRPDRRLAADPALARRAQPGRRPPLLRDRQRARGLPGGADPGRDRRGAVEFRTPVPRRTCKVDSGASGTSSGPAAFLVVAAVFSFVFAYGRYGADVGAAITLPLGAAVAAALLAGRPRLALLAFALPIPALAILSAADLLTGANAHLTSTVLDAEERRRRPRRRRRTACARRARASAARSSSSAFPSSSPPPRSPGCGRDRLAAWLRGLPAMRAGMLGALAATLVGTARQRLRRPPARDRRRLSARLRRLRLGRKRAPGCGPATSSRLNASCESPLSRHIPGVTRAA